MTVTGDGPTTRFKFELVDPVLVQQHSSKVDKLSHIEPLREYLGATQGKAWRSKKDLCAAACVADRYGAIAIERLVSAGELVRDKTGYHRPAQPNGAHP